MYDTYICNNCLCAEVCEIVGKYPVDDCEYFKNKADFVEVVRCKDCARVNKYKERYFCSCDNTQMKPYDFCSYGERK